MVLRRLVSHSHEWLFSLLLLCLSGCTADVKPLLLSGATMGTTWHVTVVVDEGTPSAASLRDGIQAQLDEINFAMSTYRDDSEISQVNEAAVSSWLEISSAFEEVLLAALTVGRASGGGYDVTVAPLVDLWGFGAGGAVQEPPEETAVKKAMANVGQDNIELDSKGMRIRKLAPVSLDFSSIAKGYAVDRVALWLQQQGVERFLAEVGGELRLSGQSGRGDKWRIAIEQPDSRARGIARAISLTDAAVATSGDYRNFFEVDGKRYSHALDPRSGYPVAHDLVSVTVVNPSAMLADAWATALIVLGAEQGMAVARSEGLAVFFISREGETFNSSYTAEFEPFLQAAQGGS